MILTKTNRTLEQNIQGAVERSEWIGVVGSPSTSNVFTVDLIEPMYRKGLVGNFCVVTFNQDDNSTLAIGQIISINLRNPYLERHSIQKIISIKGRANPLTDYHDIRQVKLSIGATYNMTQNSVLPVNIGSVPSTGTRIYSLNQDVMTKFIRPFQQDVFFVGKLYNTEILLPTIFKHFGEGEGGLSEAYHIGVFGKTGSGKSVLAKMLLMAYACHHPMSILIIDPLGEFSKEMKNVGILLHSFKKIGRRVHLYDISDISLISFQSFKKLLIISGFLNDMGVRAPENQEYAADLIVNYLASKKWITNLFGYKIEVKLGTASNRDVFNDVMKYVCKNIRRIYVTEGGQGQNRVLDYINSYSERLFKKWESITSLFDTKSDKISIDLIMQQACSLKDIIIIDLSELSAEDVYWDNQVLAIVLKDIIENLKNVGNQYFKQGQLLNLLTIIDEAHRFAPRQTLDEEEYKLLKKEFIDCIRTTRKYGLGWLFISQTLASLDQEILNQLRLYFFGYGLSWGSELRVLREIIGGGEHIALYQNFRDPQTSAILGEKQYPFMLFGPVSPLSASGRPIFFSSLNYFTEFSENNNL